MVDLATQISHDGNALGGLKKLPRAFLGDDGFVYDSAVPHRTKRALTSGRRGSDSRYLNKKADPAGARPDGFRNRRDVDWVNDLSYSFRSTISKGRAELQNQANLGQVIPKDKKSGGSRKKKKKSLDEILQYLSGNFPHNNSDSDGSSRSSSSRRNPLIRKRHVLFKKKRRQVNIFDSAAGLISGRPRYSRGKYGRWKPPKTIKDQLHSLPYAPDEVLFQRRNFPIRPVEQDIYFANEQKLRNGGEGILPDSDLLKTLHAFASNFYASHRPASWKYRKIDMASMDATALLAFGILMEELAKDISRKGYRVLTEGQANKTADGAEIYDNIGDGATSLIAQHRIKRQRLGTDPQLDHLKSEGEESDRAGKRASAKATRQLRDPFTSQIQKEILHYRKLKPLDSGRQRVGTRDSLYGSSGRPHIVATLPRINFSPDKESNQKRSKKRNKRDTGESRLESPSPSLTTVPQFSSAPVVAGDDSDADTSDEASPSAESPGVPKYNITEPLQRVREASVELGSYDYKSPQTRNSPTSQDSPTNASSSESSEADSDS